MKTNLGVPRNCSRRFFSAAIWLLWCLGFHSAKAQQPVLPAGTRAALAGTASPKEAIQEGFLFYAVAPRTEQELKRLNETSTPFSVTVPLEVDRKQGKLFVLGKIDGQPVRLLLDTGGGPAVTLNKAAAQGITLRINFQIRYMAFKAAKL